MPESVPAASLILSHSVPDTSLHIHLEYNISEMHTIATQTTHCTNVRTVFLSVYLC